MWTVVRFPDGSWSYGGKPDKPEYAKCEVWQINTMLPTTAIKIAKAERRKARKKRRARP